ncbi:MAG: hypothetical protein OEM96_04275 [Gemmatimonadota bacterium]|nr:hypothetical protein [Gemmatimonadota bacterium]
MTAVPRVGLLVGPQFADLADRSEQQGAFASLGGRTLVPVAVRQAGESARDAASRVRAVCARGVSILLVVDVAIPVRPDWAANHERYALITDHLNLTGDNPLVGPNAVDWGPRFPDLTDAWDPDLRAVLHGAARECQVEPREGVIAGGGALSSTAAEQRMLRALGADMASDGFVWDAITGRHAGRRMAGLGVMVPDDAHGREADAFRGLLSSFAAALEEAAVSP